MEPLDTCDDAVRLLCVAKLIEALNPELGASSLRHIRFPQPRGGALPAGLLGHDGMVSGVTLPDTLKPLSPDSVGPRGLRFAGRALAPHRAVGESIDKALDTADSWRRTSTTRGLCAG